MIFTSFLNFLNQRC